MAFLRTYAGAVNEKRIELADRIRSLLADESRVEDKRMFGSIAFMVEERMLVAAWGEGNLLVRVDPARSGDLLERDGVQIAEMGAKRTTMGPGWLDVDAEVIFEDAQLLFWLDLAREFHRATG